MVQLWLLLLVSAALVVASPAQRADPNALASCTAQVQTVQQTATFNPAATTCAASVPAVAINGDSTKGLQALGKQLVPDATIALVVASPACQAWYSALTTAIQGISPACTFNDPTTGSTATTTKYATTLAAFLDAANTGTGTLLTSATTATPSSSPKTTPATTTATTKTNSTNVTAAPATTPKSAVSVPLLSIAAGLAGVIVVSV
ncbi:Aste57867_5947 [Aphanomyces stellatus]|uniref:Aste57867_5947 protein n=1 Tax=Aphanomyces stellatus TaxID=120398 RepID=A0A485KFA3_9STRA|nr:hypothetical protein As57867_005933 [Aphanomyces stellatus]VFT82964.1 Aste57867_5947 [Aphanomyces stellatus]